MVWWLECPDYHAIGLGFNSLRGQTCHYPEILTAFSRALPTEKSAKVLDNICGAISRLIIANTPGVPIEQVLPVLVGHLPLKEDYVEDKWVFVALTHLYTLGNQVLLQHLPAVIHTAAHTLHSHDPDDTPSDLYLFTKLKEALGGKEVEKWLPEERLFDEGIRKPLPRLKKCIKVNGDYV
ncbi:hypothetical protein AAG570_004786 [Ranatra chinensis]|uniref:Uncharacterized protein n=1 Tax=Ranatra chinensis TaxID=642074 RepID=A0ABD0Y443_9HEMI